jgi:hypothetical protein
MKTLLKAFALTTAALALVAAVFAALESIRPAPTPKMVFGSPEWREFMTAR